MIDRGRAYGKNAAAAELRDAGYPTRDEKIQQIRAVKRANAQRGRGRWPIATDTPADRARTIANGLLAALAKADPAAAARIREQAHGYGEHWLGAQLAPDGHRMTRSEVAALAGVDPDTVSQWSSRGTRAGHLTRHPDGYDEAEVIDFLAALRASRTRTTPPEESHVVPA